MCGKPDEKSAEEWVMAEFMKGNEPEPQRFPVLIRRCACRENYVAYVPGGTHVKAYVVWRE